MANLATINNNILADSGIDPLSLIVGTGTVNYVPKFTAEDTVANSQIFDNGTNVGIGTATPSVKLHVINTAGVAAYFTSSNNSVPVSLFNNGSALATIGFKGTTTSSEFNVRVGADANDFVAYTNNTEQMRITSGGALLVGTTSNPYSLGALVVNHNSSLTRTYFQRGVDLIEIVPSDGTQPNQISSSYTISGSGYKPLSISARQNQADLYLTTGGLVGIGTTSPGSKLQVNSVAGNYGIVNTNGTVSVGTYIEASNTYASFGTQSNHPLGFFTNNNAPQMYITTAGNVGIGTTSPENAAGYATITINGSSGGQITFATSNSKKGYLYNNATNMYIGSESGALIFDAGAIEAMRITSSRNLLVGTTTDAGYKLDVNGTGRFSSSITASSGEFINGGQNGSLGSVVKISTTNTNAASRNWGIVNTWDNYGDLTFRVSNAQGGDALGAGTSIMTLLSGGNIGIGTTSPTNKFDILTADNTGLTVRSTNYSGSFSPSGLGGMALTTNGAYPLFFYINSATRMTIASNGAVRLNAYGSGSFTGTRAYDLSVDASGNIIEVPVGAGTITGSGTTNYIPKFTSSSAIGNSIVQDYGDNVWVGSNTAGYGTLNIQRFTSAPYATLTLTDQATPSNPIGLYLRSNGSSPVGISSAGAPIAFYTGGPATNEGMRLDASGNLIVGGTSSSGERLGVVGSAKISSGNLSIVYNSAAVDAFDITNVRSGGRRWFFGDGSGTSAGNFGFYDATASSLRMVIDASGNLGLGVSPSAWGSNKALEMGGGAVYTDGGNNELSIAQGAYNDGSWKYKYTGVAVGLASNYQGAHTWYTAPSGTAGNAISFTQAMTLDASGRLGIGSTNPQAPLEIVKTGTLRFNYSSGTGAMFMGDGSADMFLATQVSGAGNNPIGAYMYFKHSNSSIGIGTTSPASKLQIGSVGSTGYGVSNGLAFGDGTRAGAINVDGSGTTFYSSTNLILAPGTTEAMRITSGGNVGIGTTSPASLLNLSNTNPVITLTRSDNASTPSGAINFSSISTVRWQIGTNQAVGGGFEINEGNSTNNRFYMAPGGATIFSSNVQASYFRAYSGGVYSEYIYDGMYSTGTDQYIYTAGGYNTRFYTNSAERMRITSGGNVLVGTTTDVSGVGKFVINYASSDNYGIILNNTYTATSNNGYFQRFYNNGTEIGTFYAGNAASSLFSIVGKDGLSFATNGVPVGTERMRIATTGAVRFNAYGSGSFTGTVAYNLAVDASGNIIETAGGVVDGSGTANYVPLWSDPNTLTNSTIYQTGGGNVGINTASPAYKLDVNGTARASGMTLNAFATGTSGGNLELGFDGAQGVVQAYNRSASWIPLYLSGSDIRFNPGGVEKMRLDSVGNLGIGTTSPISAITIGKAGGAQYISSIDNTTGYEIGYIQFNTDNMTLNPQGGASGNTGYFRFITAGTEKVRIETNGNVGIGTTSPGDKLTVNGGIAILAGNSIYFNNPVNTANSSILSPGGGSMSLRSYGVEMIGLSENANILFSTGGTERMRVTSGGNVGINNTTPFNKLTVTATNDYGLITIGSNWAANTYTGIKIGAAADNGSAGVDIRAYTHYSSTNSTNMAFFTNTSAGVLSEKMRITDAGNVGIGTPTPAYKLDVLGSFNFTTGGNNLTYNNGVLYHGNYYQFPSANDYALFARTSGALIFGANDTERMRITSGGDVGIGTSSPSYKLDVVGVIRSNASNVGTLNLGTDSYSGVYTTAQVIGQTSPSYTSSGKLSFKVLTWGAGSDYGPTEQMYIDVTGPDTKSATLVMLPWGGSVGLGTTTPSSILDARVSSGATSGFRFKGWSDSATPYLLSLGTQTYQDIFQIKSVNGLVTMGIVGAVGATPDLAFQTNSTERMRITSGGNVLVGTTTDAGYKLDVSGDIRASSNIRSLTNLGFVNTNASQAGFVADYTGTGAVKVSMSTYNNIFQVYNETNGYSIFNFTPSTKTFVINPTGGNVGIGTTSPAQRLQVAGNISIDGANNGNVAQLSWTRTDVSWGINNETDLRFYSSNSNTTTPSTTRMVITSGGNVGIGTSNPANGLEIAVGASSTAGILVTGSNSPRITVTETTGTVSNSLAVDASNAYIGTITNHNLILRTNATERMRITSGGNVGIGTTNPLYKLVVSNGGAEGIEFGAGYASGKSLIQAYNRSGASYNGLDFSANSYTFSNGNVGIGTSPNKKLEVSSDATDGVRLFSTDGSGEGLSLEWMSAYGPNRLTADIESDASGGGGNFTIRVADGSAVLQNRFHIDNTGNVGIGTTSPTAKLDIVTGTSSASQTLGFQVRDLSNGGVSIYSADNSYVSSIRVGGSESLALWTNGSERMRINSGGDIWFKGVSSSTGYEAAFENSNSLFSIYGSRYGGTGKAITLWATGSSESMRINYTNNVLIGTTTDSGGRLVVNGGSVGSNIARFTTGGAGGGTRGMTVYSNDSYVKLQVTDNVGSASTWAHLVLNPDAGYVGIGTTSPAYPLEVRGNVLVGDNTTNTMRFGSYASESFIYSSSAIPLTFYTNASERMRITSGGNVGIGASSLDGGVQFQVFTSSSPQNLTRLYTGLDVYGPSGSSSAASPAIFMGGDSNTGFFSPTGDNIGFSTNGSERMRITNGGIVGIGTSSPDASTMLQVQTSNSCSVRIVSSAASGGDLYITSVNGGSESRIDKQGTAGPLTFYNNGSERMRITSSGNTELTGSIKTGAPSGGTAKPIKFGEIVTLGGSNLQGVKVEIDGTLYYLVTGYLP